MPATPNSRIRYGIASIIATIAFILLAVIGVWLSNYVSELIGAIVLIVTIVTFVGGMVLWIVGLGTAKTKKEWITAVIALLINIGVLVFMVAMVVLVMVNGVP